MASRFPHSAAQMPSPSPSKRCARRISIGTLGVSLSTLPSTDDLRLTPNEGSVIVDAIGRSPSREQKTFHRRKNQPTALPNEILFITIHARYTRRLSSVNNSAKTKPSKARKGGKPYYKRANRPTALCPAISALWGNRPAPEPPLRFPRTVRRRGPKQVEPRSCFHVVGHQLFLHVNAAPCDVDSCWIPLLVFAIAHRFEWLHQPCVRHNLVHLIVFFHVMPVELDDDGLKQCRVDRRDHLVG